MDQDICSTQALTAGTRKIEEGCEFVYLYSAAARTRKTPYWNATLDTSGIPTAAAITLGAKDCIGRVVVATETTTAAGYQWFQLKGIVTDAIMDSASYVALDMINLYDSVCTATGGTTVTPSCFAVSLETGSTTTPNVYLLGRQIVASGA